MDSPSISGHRDAADKARPQSSPASQRFEIGAMVSVVITSLLYHSSRHLHLARTHRYRDNSFIDQASHPRPQKQGRIPKPPPPGLTEYAPCRIDSGTGGEGLFWRPGSSANDFGCHSDPLLNAAGADICRHNAAKSATGDSSVLRWRGEPAGDVDVAVARRPGILCKTGLRWFGCTDGLLAMRVVDDKNKRQGTRRCTKAEATPTFPARRAACYSSVFSVSAQPPCGSVRIKADNPQPRFRNSNKQPS